MGKVITGDLTGRKVGQDFVDKRVPDDQAQSLSKKFFGHALMNPQEGCWLTEHTIVPLSILNEDLKPFFNSISDGEVVKLPDEFQTPNSDRAEIAFKEGDTVLLQTCSLPVPMS